LLLIQGHLSHLYINHFNILSTLFGTVCIPKEVANECLADLNLPGAQEIQKLIELNHLKVHEAVDLHSCSSLFDILDDGEISAIALALELNARICSAICKLFNLFDRIENPI
jgi:predicted nucleic acid-binding protein